MYSPKHVHSSQYCWYIPTSMFEYTKLGVWTSYTHVVMQSAPDPSQLQHSVVNGSITVLLEGKSNVRAVQGEQRRVCRVPCIHLLVALPTRPIVVWREHTHVVSPAGAEGCGEHEAAIRQWHGRAFTCTARVLQWVVEGRRYWCWPGRTIVAGPSKLSVAVSGAHVHE